MKNSPRPISRSTPSTAVDVAVALAQPGDADVDLSLRRHAATPQELEPAVELVVGDGQRRQQPDHVAVEAAGEQEQAALEGARR